MTHTALETFLAPLASCLAPEGVSEVSINKPQEVWIETKGEMRRADLPELDADHLKMLAGLIAEFTQQDLSPEKPLLSATFCLLGAQARAREREVTSLFLEEADLIIERTS